MLDRMFSGNVPFDRNEQDLLFIHRDKLYGFTNMEFYLEKDAEWTLTANHIAVQSKEA